MADGESPDFGHRQAGAVREVLDEGVELRGFFARDFLGAAPTQDEGVAAPVAVLPRTVDAVLLFDIRIPLRHHVYLYIVIYV